MHAKAGASGGRGGLWYLLGTLGLGIAAVVTAWLLSFDVPRSLSDLDPEPVPVTVPVMEAEARFSVDATLAVKLTPVSDLIAPSQTGTVTSIEMAPGMELSNGSRLYSVDDRQVVAYVDDGVFFRELSKGDKGDDVALMQTVLNSLLPERAVWVDGDFGDGTELLVKKWESQQGVAQPTGTFSPAWFVRLPAPSYTVDQVKIRAGQPVPAAGEPLATGLSLPTAATVTPANDEGAPVGDYVFTFEGKSVALSLTEDGWVVADLDQAAHTTSRPTEGDTATVEGNLRLAEPESGMAVPAAALISDGVNTCVAVQRNTNEFTKAPVSVLDGLVDGSVVIDGDIAIGDIVLLNPGEILDSAQCL